MDYVYCLKDFYGKHALQYEILIEKGQVEFKIQPVLF